MYHNYHIAEASISEIEYKDNASTKEIFSMVLLQVPCHVLFQFFSLIALFVASHSQMHYQTKKQIYYILVAESTLQNVNFVKSLASLAGLQCGKDQLFFLWERRNFVPLKSQNYCTNQYQILNEWLRWWDKNCPTWLKSVIREHPHKAELYTFQIIRLLFPFFFFCFFLSRQLAYRPQFATDFDLRCLKRCGLM